MARSTDGTNRFGYAIALYLEPVWILLTVVLYTYSAAAFGSLVLRYGLTLYFTCFLFLSFFIALFYSRNHKQLLGLIMNFRLIPNPYVDFIDFEKRSGYSLQNPFLVASLDALLWNASIHLHSAIELVVYRFIFR